MLEARGRQSPFYNATMIAELALLICQVTPQGGLQDQIDSDTRFREERISKWRPAASYLVPTGELQRDESLLPGKWRSDHGLEISTLTFTAGVRGKFNVAFYTAGCLSRWNASRTATLSKGVIKLNRAVETYSGTTFDRLYFLKRDGRFTLVPLGSVERAKELGAKQPAEIEGWVDHFQFTR